MLDEKDKKILEILTKDCRTPTTKIAKLVKLSQPTVIYRIQNLEKKGYISSYDAILNLNLLPHNKFIIFASTNNKNFENKLKKDKRVNSVIRLTHKYNYWILCTTKEKNPNFEFLKNVKHLNYKLKNIIYKPYSLFSEKISLPKKRIAEKVLKLDDTDKKILSTLSNGNAKKPLLELSRELNTTYDIVNYKFKKLRKANYFPIMFAQPGQKFHLQVDIAIIKTKLSFNEIQEELNSTKQIVYLINLGNNTYQTQILTQSFKEYKEVLEKINNKLREHTQSIEIYNTKDWLFLNRYNFKTEMRSSQDTQINLKKGSIKHLND